MYWMLVLPTEAFAEVGYWLPVTGKSN